MKRNIYYARVSTTSQNLDRQLSKDIENRFSDKDIFTDKVSGSLSFEKRVNGSKVLELVRAGMVASVTVHSLDRFGRDLSDIQKNLEVLKAFNVNFISLKEGIQSIGADGKPNKINELLLIVLGWFADFERERIAERRNEGIEAHRIKGKKKILAKGSTLSDKDLLKKHSLVVDLLTEGLTPTQINKKTKVSRVTIYKVKNLVHNQ